MLKEVSSVFSFLTIIPSNNTNLETVAKYMHVFPIIGIAIGLLIGSIGFGLSFFLDPMVVALLVVGSIVVITGVHHTDGLADFADGLMTKGTKNKKLKAMKDLSTGSAGIVSVVLYVIGAIIALSLTSGFALFQAILLSEILAKFSMGFDGKHWAVSSSWFEFTFHANYEGQKKTSGGRHNNNNSTCCNRRDCRTDTFWRINCCNNIFGMSFC